MGRREEVGREAALAGNELSGNEAMGQEIIVRKCESLDDFHRCVDLQREVWGEADLEVEPATMFVVAAHTGGEVLGAFDGTRLVGYTLAVVGLRDRLPYLHSHMTRLGAICRKYHPNLYGVTTSPLHRGLATDRLLVEWHLDSARVVAAIENLVKGPVDAPAIIELPAELDRWQREGSSQVGIVQARVREEFAKWFAKGYAAVALRSAPGNRAYLLTPWSDF